MLNVVQGQMEGAISGPILKEEGARHATFSSEWKEQPHSCRLYYSKLCSALMGRVRHGLIKLFLKGGSEIIDGLIVHFFGRSLTLCIS